MTRILLDRLGGRVSAGVRKGGPTLVHGIGLFLDRNHEAVFHHAPTKHLVFTKKDSQLLFDSIGIAPEEVQAAVDDMPEFRKGGVVCSAYSVLIRNDPFNVLSALVAREYDMAGKKKELEAVLMYMGFKFYSYLVRYKWFQYEPNANVVAYTMANLSEKFKYKTLRNNYAVIKDTIMYSHGTYRDIMHKGDDQFLLTYLPQAENRCNKVIGGIAEQVYKNLEEKNYLNFNRTTSDEDGSAIENASTSGLLESMIEGSTASFVTGKVNMGLVKVASERHSVPVTTMYQCLTGIKRDQGHAKISELYRALLNVLVDSDPTVLNRVCSTSFTSNAMRQISISNTSSDELLRVKRILDDLLMTSCAKYAATNRPATKMAYRNALFSYFLFLLVLNKCHT
jgi:hypothetical protein